MRFSRPSSSSFVVVSWRRRQIRKLRLSEKFSRIPMLNSSSEGHKSHQVLAIDRSICAPSSIPPGMSHLTPPTARLQSAPSSGQGASSHESPPLCFPASETMQPMGNRPHHPFIHNLDDDSLLIIFIFCRPVLIDEDENDDERILQGGNWARERWWYKLVQVCQRWRHLVLASASYLDLCLVCTYGTPVADMLAQSSPLPLIINYPRNYPRDQVTAEDEEGVVLALQHRNRVRRIRIQMPASNLERLIAAIDGEFPVLEYLYFELPGLMFPETLQAPRLRHLILLNMTIPMRSPLLITCVGLVTLALQDASAYFSPNNLLQRLSPMHHLESLSIFLDPLFPNWRIERQLLLTPITLLNLRWFRFDGPNAYLEALLLQITAPLLEKIHISSTYPRTFRLPCLLQFMNATENLRFGSARFRFCSGKFSVWVYPQTGARTYSFCMHLYIGDPLGLGLLVACIAQIVRELTIVFSVVEHLTLESVSYLAQL